VWSMHTNVQQVFCKALIYSSTYLIGENTNCAGLNVAHAISSFTSEPIQREKTARLILQTVESDIIK
jgi:hypothetical protein